MSHYYRPKRTAKKFEGPTKAVILRSDNQDWLKLITPYNADFVNELKSTILPPHRQWDPDGKFWKVNEIYLEELIPILKKYYDIVETGLISDEVTDNNLFRKVFEVVDDRDKVYYALAQALSPDHGGSQELMNKLNEAYQEAK